MYKALLASIFVCTYALASAGDDPRVRYLGIEQGLSNNAVTCVCQDAKGFLWFGTYDGLNRYDGYGFTVYRNVIGDSTSLAFDNIASVKADPHNNIWVSGQKGVSILDPVTGRFSVPSYISWDGGAPQKVRESVHCIQTIGDRFVLAGAHRNGVLLFEGRSRVGRQIPLGELAGDKGAYDVYAIEYDQRSKTVWVFIQNRGLYVLDVDHQRLSLVNGAVKNAFCLKLDNEGTPWVGTDNGVVFLDRTKNQYSHNYLPQSSRVVSITVDGRNDMCLGTDGSGVWTLHPGDRLAAPLLSSTGTPLVNSNAVYALYEDGDGRRWIGTLRGGINVIEPKTSSFKTITYDPPGQKNIVNNFILSFCEDADHNLWIGTDGAGLRFWKRRTNTFRTYTHNPADPGSINNDFITGILRDSQDQLWVATWFDGVSRLDKATGKFTHFPCVNPETNTEEKHVWALVEDHNKQLWASATNEGGLYRFEGGRFVLFDEQVSNLQALTEDREGNLWGGNYTTLIRIDREHKKHTFFPIGYTVRCLHEDREGRFWVGTQEGGLLLFNRSTGTYTRYSTADGLPGNTILRILEDRHGNLWMSTYNGLSEYQQGRFRNFSPSDGLQSTQFSFNAGLALSSGELAFGGIKGFNLFFPDSVLQTKKMPNVYLTQVRIKNEPIRGNSRWVTDRSEDNIRELTVPFNQAMLSLDFTALEYGSTDKINYAYCLSGWDKGWSYTNGSRTANYSSIREGSYVFKVRVSHADGTWSHEWELLRVVVLPPWYRTWWAYAGYVLLVGGLVLLYVRYTRGRLRLKYEVRLAQLETEKEKELIERKLSFFTHITHEFRSPLTLIINPVKELLESDTREDEQERLPFVYRNAQRLLSLVDQLLLFRKAESGSDDIKPAPVDAVALCREVYLCFVEGARAKKIRYLFDTPVEALLLYLDREKIEIALYNLVSNALKYTPEGREVVLSLREDADTVLISVADTGIGIPPEVGDQVFDKFYQIRRSDMTSISGFGIGLFLVKQFVVAHGGEITYQSEAGKGTCFRLQFLKGNGHLKGVVIGGENTGRSSLFQEIAETPDPTRAGDLVSGQKSLLIVDDDAQILSYVQQVFERHFIVYKALSGDEGLRLAREHRPDLIISDVHMEGISGIELCETIKNDPLLGQTPVILLTASASANNKLEGVKHGADDYITKPFDRDLLVARVGALLTSRDRVEQSIYHTITTGDNAPRVSAEDKEFLDRIVAVVEAHLEEEDFSIKKLSLELGMSHSHLYQKLKDLTGQSLNGLIRFIRLRKAAELFIHSPYNVNEVALQVGIGDGKYFREQFHKQYGMNPSDYIKKYRKVFSNKWHLKRAP
ncbi:two-component regulator propeller domain-containing protein [Dinghuibacter silviterrae]|uniref:histidine kinase n=1 Tax=Dinghuibacter silviterrae TaxID=1539049 RepID=A0A4R8DFU7_9BACT|nr:two-component regulator propeller domain-containing protein [Dinghuibacter silviterrae]TDW95820.1 signal transduction histidine kinase [Dinghuibacter silviterrae]